MGTDDKTRAIDEIITHSLAGEGPCIISGVSEKAKEYIEENYKGRFEFTTNEGSYDYVYDINDLADLKGRRYASKRNHLRHFFDTYKDARVLPITEELYPKIKELLDSWYSERADSIDDFGMERLAIERALKSFKELSLEGIVLLADDRVLAVTVGSRMNGDTIDVHFEKAKLGVDGAYAAINREFASYIRQKYPEIKYLDREEDMGIPGLRRAKESYYPCRKIVKYKARLLENVR
jgi:hypothetical protein